MIALRASSLALAILNGFGGQVRALCEATELCEFGKGVS